MAATHLSGPLYVEGDIYTGGVPLYNTADYFTTASISSSTTLEGGGIILADSTAGAIVLTLPPAATEGVLYHIKKVDSSPNTVAIATSGSDKIDGDSSVGATTQYESVTMISDGTTNWYII